VGHLLPVLGSVCFLFLAPGVVAGFVPWWISHWRLQPPLLGFASLRVAGALLIVAGVSILLDSFARFALQGLGTPAPAFPTKRLVVTGLYRYVRNPMYLGVAAAIFGHGLLLGNIQVLVYGLLVGLIVHLFVMGYEEPTLRRTYGAEYDVFCKNVSRWLPRLRPWRGSARL
jgi:protein-S-isoprenylcysteine O-methyltransferase Ste14